MELESLLLAVCLALGAVVARLWWTLRRSSEFLETLLRARDVPKAQNLVIRIEDFAAQIPDRDQIEVVLDREIFRARRYGRPFSLVLVEASSMPREGRISIAHSIRKLVRVTDDVGIWDDDRLAVVLAESKHSDALQLSYRLIDHLRKTHPGEVDSLRVGFAEHQKDASMVALASAAEAAMQETSNWAITQPPPPASPPLSPESQAP